MLKIAPFGQAQVQVARQIDELLGLIAGELDAVIDPHELALRQLGIDASGWTKFPYQPEAFKIWDEILRRTPDDVETLHHLAIMHHARAFDLENGTEPSKSNADWEAALRHWRRLWELDPFWNRIADMACKGAKRDPVDALRAEFPSLLLQVHYDIAFDPMTKSLRAKYHLDLAAKSTFPAKFLRAVRAATYNRFVESVPKEAWNIDAYDPQTIKLGSDAIQRFLELDPGCDLALEDALRLQVRLLRAWHTDLQPEGDNSPKRWELLQRLKGAADAWRPHFDQLVVVPATRDDDVRRKMSLWYRVMGDVFRALDREGDAIHFYDQGVKGGLEDDGERKRCATLLGETYASLAREKASRGAPDAKSYCEQVRKRADLSVGAHVLLAHAYVRMSEFEVAKAICTRGLQLTVDGSQIDDEAKAAHDGDLEHLREMDRAIDEARNRQQAREVCNRAAELIKADKVVGAIETLNSAEKIASNEPTIYFMRCQCHLALERPNEARADLEQFKKWMRRDSEAAQAIKEFEIRIAELEVLVGTLGAHAMGLRRQATEHARMEQFPRAAELLRAALAKCSRKGRPLLQNDLSIVLANWAIREASEIAKKNVPAAAKKAEFKEALTRLDEACRLDAKNAHAKENLTILTKVVAQL